MRRARRDDAPRFFTCAGCRVKVVSRAADPSDSDVVFCLPCLGKRPEATFSQRLRALRLAAGLSRGAVARRAGVSWFSVERYELGGRQPRRPQLARLVRVLGPELIPPADVTGA
jgi:hypothetical protein